MSELFLFYEKDTDEINELYNILKNNYSLDVIRHSFINSECSIGEPHTLNNNQCDLYEIVKNCKVAVFCLTNHFIKSNECMQVYEYTKKIKKPFVILKFEEIVFKNVKNIALMFDDKKNFELYKDKEKKPYEKNGRFFNTPRFLDFLKTIANHLDKLDLKYQHTKVYFYFNVSFKRMNSN